MEPNLDPVPQTERAEHFVYIGSVFHAGLEIQRRYLARASLLEDRGQIRGALAVERAQLQQIARAAVEDHFPQDFRLRVGHVFQIGEPRRHLLDHRRPLPQVAWARLSEM